MRGNPVENEMSFFLPSYDMQASNFTVEYLMIKSGVFGQWTKQASPAYVAFWMLVTLL